MWLDRASAFAPRPRPYRDLGTERAGFTGLTWFLCKLGDRPAGPHGQPILFMSSTLPFWPPDNTARAVVLIRWDPNRTGEYRATLSLPRHRPPLDHQCYQWKPSLTRDGGVCWLQRHGVICLIRYWSW